MSTSNTPASNTNQVLWCLSYDTQTLYRQFLQISFSRYLKNLLSNKYFPSYQKQMFVQINNKYQWTQKCWQILQLFQFLNQSFQIGQLDIIVNFIQEENIRRVMGHFRLWIDLQRLYLFNFLKLDRMEFMEDRIYMTLYRYIILNLGNISHIIIQVSYHTLLYRLMLFLFTLFSEYDYDDFLPQFIHKFSSRAVLMLTQMTQYLSKPCIFLVDNIISIFSNFCSKSPSLISAGILQRCKRQVKIKITQQAQTISSIQQRLYHSLKCQQKIQDENKVKMILEMSFIDGLTKEIQSLYDPKKKIIDDYHNFLIQNNQKEDPYELQKRLKQYHDKANARPNNTLYQRLQLTPHDPYEQNNFSIYGSLINIDYDKRQTLIKKEEKQVISKNDDDDIRLYYQPQFIQSLCANDQNHSKVTKSDLRRKNATTSNKNIQSMDDQNKIYNLKYNFIQSPSRSPPPSSTPRDYQNNILFKNQIDQYIETSKQQSLSRLHSSSCHSKTFYEIKKTLAELFPADFKGSFGSSHFNKREPLIYSIENSKTLNRNKFDQMRKIIHYMSVQKKIKRLIIDKDIPDIYNRAYQHIKILYHDTDMFEDKIKYATKQINIKPEIL